MAVANAIISAAPRGGGTFTATSDTNGIYALVKIPSATQYMLTVTKAGYPAMVGSYSTGTSGGWLYTCGDVGGADFKLTYLQILPQSGFYATGPVGGPFDVTAQSYSLTNYGLTALNWTLANTSVWLNVSSSSGTLASGGPASTITVSLNDMARDLPGGTYSAQICFTNTNDGVVISRQFTLQVVPDTQNPAINILYPTSGMVLSNTRVQVIGNASDNVAVASVWCQINSGSWIIATGTNNWTATMNVAAGNNTIQAYALDTSGNRSPTNSVNFVEILKTAITVQTNGLGSLNTNYNGQLLQVGNQYAITAAAGTGFQFTNWTGGTGFPLAVLTNGTTLQFIVQSNLVLQANFVDVTKPTNTITAPTAGQHMTNALATIVGKASDNWKVAGVWYQLNSNAWNLVTTTTNNYTNWTQTVTLLTGTNTVKAYAVDLGGNFSTTNALSIVSSNTFTLQLVFTNALPLKTNGLVFSLQLSKGLNGHIQVSTNLTSWATLTNFTGTNTTLNFRDPAATNSSYRYYRAVIP